MPGECECARVYGCIILCACRLYQCTSARVCMTVLYCVRVGCISARVRACV